MSAAGSWSCCCEKGGGGRRGAGQGSGRVQVGLRAALKAELLPCWAGGGATAAHHHCPCYPASVEDTGANNGGVLSYTCPVLAAQLVARGRGGPSSPRLAPQSSLTKTLAPLLPPPPPSSIRRTPHRHTSPGVLVPALRTVGNIVTGNDMQTQVIINCGALACLLNLLMTNHKKSIKKEACWTISNITAGTKDQIQAVIDAGLIPPLIGLLATAEFDIKKEAAWAISNATSGGTADQIKYLVGSSCIKPLCDLLAVNDTRIITVALEGLENILKVGGRGARGGGGVCGAVRRVSGCARAWAFVGQASWLHQLCAAAALLHAVCRRCSAVSCNPTHCTTRPRVPPPLHGPRADRCCLDCPPAPLQIGQQMRNMPGSNGLNPFAQLVEDGEGLDKVEQLQDHPNEDLYEKAVHILETYFDVDEGDDQNLAPGELPQGHRVQRMGCGGVWAQVVCTDDACPVTYCALSWFMARAPRMCGLGLLQAQHLSWCKGRRGHTLHIPVRVPLGILDKR